MTSVRKKWAVRGFLAADRIGLHILPKHYYSSIPSRRELHQTEAEWRRPLNPVPFAWDLDAQVEWLSREAADFPREVPLTDIYAGVDSVGGFRYGPIEAQFLHSWIRTNHPRRILEIGSGSSTLVMSRAVTRNCSDGQDPTEIVACDPYTAHHVSGLGHVVARPIRAQAVGNEALDLKAGDLLFIDSTHSLRTGSELPHLYLEVIPRLAPGVIIHIHDIYLPYLYSPDIYASIWDWQETALLAALLTGNEKLQVLASMSALHHYRSDALKSVFAEYDPRPMVDGLAALEDDRHFPSSMWLKVQA